MRHSLSLGSGILEMWILLLASLLSGCVQYDVGVSTTSHSQGGSMQHKLEEQLAQWRLSSGMAKPIERRAQQHTRQTRAVEPKNSVTIPFNNGAEHQEAEVQQIFNSSKKNSETVTKLQQMNCQIFGSPESGSEQHYSYCGIG